MSRHRLEDVRPRYGRMASAALALLVTATSVAGGIGLIPAGGQSGSPAGAATSLASADLEGPAGEPVAPRSVAPLLRATPEQTAAPAPAGSTALPSASGQGRRIVFSESAQRVWLVAPGDRVRRSYLVSGSAYDNLDPGTYAVFSRSERAWGIDDSGSMRWFVRFAHGPNAAIGFHDIPVHQGELVQTAAQLGTPLSHGCIRQRPADAKALWDFAPVGTTVVVVA